MIRFNSLARTTAAALLAVGFAGAAGAEEWTGPRVVGTGENASVVYAGPAQNVVGGALTRQVGSGESAMTVVISAPVSQEGRVGRVVGTGENTSVAYDAPRG
jgi:hypothetical protein